MITKCVKIAIYPHENIVLNNNKIYKIMHDISYQTRQACNHAMNLQYQELMRQVSEKKEIGEARSFKEIEGITFNTWLYHQMKDCMLISNSSCVNATQRFVTSKANFNSVNILRGDESLSTFKSNMPMFLHNGSYKIQKQEDGRYMVSTALVTRETNKELGRGVNERFNFAFVKPDNNLKSILDKIMSKEYKQGASQISYDKRKKKWYMTITFSFEPQKKELNPNKTLGVDLGITKVATMSVLDNEKQQYDWVSYKEGCIDGQELIHHRQKLEARKRNMQASTKWASDNKIGHGRKQRTSDVDKIESKYSRFRDTYNHKISRYIVDFAVKRDCGVIQMENLSGFSNEQGSSLLRNWAYFDLQEKVKYKAEEKGIVVNLINPRYTSQRCSKCGCIDKDNRKTQADFKCTTCGHTMNADVNASRNIAINDIENIIDEWLKVVKDSEKKAS